MDQETHIFGRGELKPEVTYKLISATLELARIRDVTLKNFPKAKKEMMAVEVTLIEVAKAAGISEVTYRDTVKKVLGMRHLKPVKEETKDETGSPNGETTDNQPQKL